MRKFLHRLLLFLSSNSINYLKDDKKCSLLLKIRIVFFY